MNTLERLKILSENAVVPNETYIVIPKTELDMLLDVVQAGDKLATHVDGLLDLKAVSTPENTKHWLDEYRKARSMLES